MSNVAGDGGIAGTLPSESDNADNQSNTGVLPTHPPLTGLLAGFIPTHVPLSEVLGNHPRELLAPRSDADRPTNEEEPDLNKNRVTTSPSGLKAAAYTAKTDIVRSLEERSQQRARYLRTRFF